MTGKAWILPFLASAGCIDQGVSKEQDGQGVDDPPEIEVYPTALEFGDLGPGEETRRRFTVVNRGAVGSDLELSRIELEGDAPFSFVEVPGDGTVLEQGESLEVVVEFTPVEPRSSDAVARVHSNDEDEPVVEVTLAGSGIIPILEIIPDPLDLGRLPVGCATSDDLTLRNTGNADLILSDIRFGAEAFGIANVPSLPAVLEPGRSTLLTVDFEPAAAGEYEAALTVVTNEAEGEHVARQLAVGTALAVYHDVFDIPFDPPVDILFFVDQSDSMSDDQAALASNFELFIDRLAEVTADWSVLPVTRDDGCNEYGILTPSTPGYRDLFLQAVTLGTSGDRTEAGLTIAANAMDESKMGGCNAGFARDDSYVHVILVSDEPEQSPDPWSDYVARMVEAADGAASFKVSAVAGDFPDGCESATNSASPGSGYWEAVVATGGTFLSLCSSWSSHADTLAMETTTRNRFPLTGPADTGTIEVWVNDVFRTDWSYDVPANAVIFPLDSAPREGDEVVVDYVEPLVCP